jgi:hypothetical protein
VADVSSLGFRASSSRCPTPLACCAKFDENRMPIPGSLSGSDPLNLAGILTPGPKITSLAGKPGALSGWRTDGFVVGGRSDLFQRTRSGNRMASRQVLLRAPVRVPSLAPETGATTDEERVHTP